MNDTKKPDGRKRLATGRTYQFATRVTEDFHTDFKQTAINGGLTMTVLLEKCLIAYKGGDMQNESLIEHWRRSSKDEKVQFLKLIDVELEEKIKTRK